MYHFNILPPQKGGFLFYLKKFRKFVQELIDKRKMALQNITQKEFIKALKKNRFNVSKACEIVGVSRQAHYQWLENDEAYKQAYSELTESVLDIAEESLLELVQGAYKEVIDKDNQVRVLKEPPHAQSVMYLLDRLGKKRGYVNKEASENETIIKLIRE